MSDTTSQLIGLAVILPLLAALAWGMIWSDRRWPLEEPSPVPFDRTKVPGYFDPSLGYDGPCPLPQTTVNYRPEPPQRLS